MKIKIPEGMLKAIDEHLYYPGHLASPQSYLGWRKILTVAFEWLSENPIVPTDEQLKELMVATNMTFRPDICDRFREMMADWQRSMFLEPDPDEPIRDLILSDENDDSDARLSSTPKEFNRHVREAYRRGLEAAKLKT
jgi:hypothetical protein